MSYRKERKRNTAIGDILWGLGSAMISCLLLCAVCAILILTEVVPQSGMACCAMIIIIISSFLGTKMTAAGEKGIFKKLVTSICFFTVLLCVGIAIPGTSLDGVGATGGIVLSGWGVAVLTEGDDKRGKKRYRKRYGHG